MVSVNFSRVIAVHAMAPGHSSSGFHLLREMQHGSARHAVQRREVHLHLVDTHLLRERGRDRVVHVLREGASASGSFTTARPPTILSGRFVGIRGRPCERIVADGH